MQKPRHRKTAMQLWVADNRKRLGETPADLARLTGVTTDTARGWESRGSPGEDAIRLLEVHFGVSAPMGSAGLDDTSRSADPALIEALTAQTKAITALVERLDLILPSEKVREMLSWAAEHMPAESPSPRPTPDPDGSRARS